MLDKILQSLGLTTKEAEAYLVLLRLGPSPISVLAKKVSLPRSSGYNLLKRMEEKHFVRHLQRANTLLFFAIAPDEIPELVKTRQEKLADALELVKTYLPQLQNLINPHVELPKVIFYEGRKGVQEIYLDILAATEFGASTKAFVTLEGIEEELKEWIVTKFTKKKVKRQIFSQVILSTKHITKYIRLDHEHLRETRAVPYQSFPFHVEIDLYGKNRIAVISFAADELFGIIIESHHLFTTLGSIFQFVWEASGKRNPSPRRAVRILKR